MNEQVPKEKMSRPILFSAPMVRALLAGTKTQTRRIVKRHPLIDGDFTDEFITMPENHVADNCPYGKPGDRLWVRETWRELEYPTIGSKYDYRECAVWRGDAGKYKWRPSIFMPREACRLTLRITGVRVERLQAITEDDARAEGTAESSLVPIIGACWSERDAYAKLWEHINGKGSWAANPWVWAVSFEGVAA